MPAMTVCTGIAVCSKSSRADVEGRTCASGWAASPPCAAAGAVTFWGRECTGLCRASSGRGLGVRYGDAEGFLAPAAHRLIDLALLPW